MKPNVEDAEGITKMLFYSTDPFAILFPHNKLGNLEQVITNNVRTLSSTNVFNIVKGVCLGLKALHEKNISHRNLKLRNVMIDVDSKGEVKAYLAAFYATQPMFYDDNAIAALPQYRIDAKNTNFVAPEVFMALKGDVPRLNATAIILSGDLFSLAILISKLMKVMKYILFFATGLVQIKDAAYFIHKIKIGFSAMSKTRLPKAASASPTEPNFPYKPLSDPLASASPSPAVSRKILPSPSDVSMSRFSTADSITNPEDADTIRVVVRIRPMNSLERNRSDGQCTFAADDGQTVTIQKIIDGKPVKPMTFHKTFGEVTNQEQIFEESGVKNLIEKAVEGYVSTIFAYGQTGAGKSFTITGPENMGFNESSSENWGIVPRSLRYLFELITAKSAEGHKFTIHASYLQIYNEQVQDLLNSTSTSLPVRYSREKKFYVENLFVVECDVLDDCLAVLEEGLKNRTVGSHRLNEHSSRSHGLMTVTIDCDSIDPDDGRTIKRTGKISFVDLAGSEKVKESRAQGDTLTETLNINKSLLTLGNCISALADMKKKNTTMHVPYRDSKLTKLLCDSLGGSGLALMVACVSPSAVNVNETLNTLRYASRAKKIQNRPVVQMDPREELIANLKRELKFAKTENENLRILLAGKSTSQLPVAFTQHEQAVSTEEMDALKKQIDEYKTKEMKWQREQDELMHENDRLIGKMERLLEIFGTSFEALENGPHANAGLHPAFKAPSTARLFLMSQKASISALNSSDTKDSKALVPAAVNTSKKSGIDRSTLNISSPITGALSSSAQKEDKPEGATIKRQPSLKKIPSAVSKPEVKPVIRRPSKRDSPKQ